MPQLDFNVAFSNFLFLIMFFIFFYMLVYFYVFPRLFKMILTRKYYIFHLEKQLSDLRAQLVLKKDQNFEETKKLLSFFKQNI